MKLLQLRAEYFRNIHALDLSPSPHINIIYGDNGSGKSTLLEMIYCLSRGRSFRTHLASPIIQYHQDYCTIFGAVGGDNFSTHIGFKKNKQGKTTLKVGYDQKPPTTQALSELLPVQLFHPESHDLLNSGPSLRRKFIDWGLFYTEPRFIALWSRFHQGLKQRNAALAQKQPANQISAWDIELADIGDQLSQLRGNYIDQLIQVGSDWIRKLVGDAPITLSYHLGWDVRQPLLSVLKNNLNRDLKYGYTVEGPHRFDLSIKRHDFPVEKVFSRGEQKRLICALYLAQGQILKDFTHKSCIYLLDDILSELDSFYQAQVLAALKTLDAQVFVTSLDREKIKPLLLEKECHLFHVVDGVLNQLS